MNEDIKLNFKPLTDGGYEIEYNRVIEGQATDRIVVGKLPKFCFNTYMTYQQQCKNIYPIVISFIFFIQKKF